MYLIADHHYSQAQVVCKCVVPQGQQDALFLWFRIPSLGHTFQISSWFHILLELFDHCVHTVTFKQSNLISSMNCKLIQARRINVIQHSLQRLVVSEVVKHPRDHAKHTHTQLTSVLQLSHGFRRYSEFVKVIPHHTAPFLQRIEGQPWSREIHHEQNQRVRKVLCRHGKLLQAFVIKVPVEYPRVTSCMICQRTAGTGERSLWILHGTIEFNAVCTTCETRCNYWLG